MESTVTSYLEQENEILVTDPDKLDEWKAKAEELGLEGQMTLCKEGKSPIPFMWMNEGLMNMFKVLCGKSMDFKEYDKAPIPMEAMGLIGLAVKEQYFDEIYIRYDDVDPDPIAIGVAGKEKYLIARWGDERLSLEQLREKAVMRWAEKARRKLNESIAQAQADLDGIQQLAEKHMAGEYVAFYI